MPIFRIRLDGETNSLGVNLVGGECPESGQRNSNQSLNVKSSVERGGIRYKRLNKTDLRRNKGSQMTGRKLHASETTYPRAI